MSALQADALEKIGRLVAGLRAPVPRPCSMIGSATAAPTRHARIEAGEGILEDHLDAAAHAAQTRRVEAQHVVAVEADAAAVRLDEADDRAAGRRFAAAGFADERQRLALEEIEGDILDRMDRAGLAAEQAAADVETGDEVLHLEDRRLAAVDGIGHLDRLAAFAGRRCRRRESAAAISGPAIEPSRGTAESSARV